MLTNIIANPISAVSEANYLGVLFWAVVIGLALKRFASEETRKMLNDFSGAVPLIVRWIINLAPLGICGLVYEAVAENGMDIFVTYGALIALLVGVMLIVALVLNAHHLHFGKRHGPLSLAFFLKKK